MLENNLSIGETTTHLLPQIQNDSFITEDLMAMGIEGNLLEEIKICKRYLRVMRRSDIETGNGKGI